MRPSWRQAKIAVTYKEAKDKVECSSYRPILTLEYKIFTAVLGGRMDTETCP